MQKDAIIGKENKYLKIFELFSYAFYVDGFKI